MVIIDNDTNANAIIKPHVPKKPVARIKKMR